MTEVTYTSDGLASRCRTHGPVTHIALEGKLDLSTACVAEAALNEALSARPTTVVLDLGGLSFIDAAGLEMLMRTKAEVDARSAQLLVSRHSRASRQLVELADLTHWLAPTDQFGNELIPCPVCDGEITPLARVCGFCGSAL